MTPRWEWNSETTLCLLLKGIPAPEPCHPVIQSRSIREVAGQRGEVVSAVVLGRGNPEPTPYHHHQEQGLQCTMGAPQSRFAGRVKWEELVDLGLLPLSSSRSRGRGGGRAGGCVVLISSESLWANPLVQAHQKDGKYSSCAWLPSECSPIEESIYFKPISCLPNERHGRERGRVVVFRERNQGQRWPQMGRGRVYSVVLPSHGDGD